jgi:hypothetical protein
MPRKTVHIEDLVHMVNHRLRLSDEALAHGILKETDTPGQAFRKALYGLLEPVLMEADQYKGFAYLEPPVGDYDETRRAYYAPWDNCP